MDTSFQTLVLNRLWQAVNVVGVERAFSLLALEHAQVIYAEDGRKFSIQCARLSIHRYTRIVLFFLTSRNFFLRCLLQRYCRRIGNLLHFHSALL